MFTGYFFVDAYSGQDIPPGILLIPELDLGIGDIYFIGPVIGELNLMIWVSFLLAVVAYVVLFRTPANLRLRACGRHARHRRLPHPLCRCRHLGCTQNMTGGRGFIALAALIFGMWRPFRALGAAMLFGFSTALAYRLPVYSESLPGIEVLVQALPYVLTLIAVAGVIGRSTPPAAVGRPYKKQ